MSAETGDTATDGPPDAVAGRERGETVRFQATDTDGWVAGEVDEARVEPDTYASVTVITPGYRGSLYDLETHYDPRTGWAAVQVLEREYQSQTTEFVERGALQELDVVSLGVGPGDLRPGWDVEHVDGTVYRVVETPAEREYDCKVLAYDRDGPGNTVAKVSTDELLADTIARPTDPEVDS